MEHVGLVYLDTRRKKSLNSNIFCSAFIVGLSHISIKVELETSIIGMDGTVEFGAFSTQYLAQVVMYSVHILHTAHSPYHSG